MATSYGNWKTLTTNIKIRAFIVFTVTETTNTTRTVTVQNGYEVHTTKRSGTTRHIMEHKKLTANVKDSKGNYYMQNGTYSAKGFDDTKTHTYTYGPYSKHTHTYTRGTSDIVLSFSQTVSGHFDTYSISSGGNVSGLGATETFSVTSNATITIPARPKYAITYNSGAGATAITSGSYYYDYSYTIPSNATPTKMGYTFQNWTLGTNKYVANNTIPNNILGNTSRTLTANWSENSYPVTFDANGDGTSNIPPNGTRKYTSSYTIPITTPARVYEDEEYAFMYWLRTEGNVKYKPGDTINVANSTESITLKAIWQKDFIITVDDPHRDGNRCINYPPIENFSTNQFSWSYNTPITFLPNYPIINYIKVLNVIYNKTSDTEVDSSKTYYIYNESSDSYEVVSVPIKANLSQYYEQINDNAYYSHYSLKEWQIWDTDSGETIELNDKMPAKNLTINPVWTGSQLLNITSNNIVRADAIEDAGTWTYKQNDTGTSALIRLFIEGAPYIFKYLYTTNETTGEEVYQSPIINYIDPTYEVKAISSDLTKTFTMTFTDSNLSIEKGWVTDNENDVDAARNIFDLDTKYDIIINGEAKKVSNDYTIDLTGNAINLTDFISRAVFTIDFSANGDRIGIFQPIEDLSDTKAEEIQENEVELSGNFIIKDQSKNIVLNRDGSIFLKDWFIQQNDTGTISFFYMGAEEEES